MAKILFVVAIFAIFIQSSYTFNNNNMNSNMNNEEGEMTNTEIRELCRTQRRLGMKAAMETVNECSHQILDAHHFNPRGFINQMGCIVKCAMKKESLLDETERFTNKSLSSALNDRIPLVFHSLAHNLVGNCIEKFGENHLVPEEPNCRSYSRLGLCLEKVFINVCDELPERI